MVLTLLVFGLGAKNAHASELTAIKITPYFTVHYAPADPYLAESITESANDELKRISAQLGYRVERGKPFPLLVYRTHYAFIKEGGLEDKYTVGTARSSDEAIAVDASGAFVTSKLALTHELTHVIIFRILGSKAYMMPLWMNEGLAKYESEDYSETDRALVADAAANDTLIPLYDLSSSFPKDRIDLSYAESGSAARYFIDRYGESAPKVLLAELDRTGSFDKAMKKATGKDGDEFIAEWSHSIGSRFGMLRIGRIAGALGGMFMAILAIIAFLVRRKQKIQASKEWEWEQFEESMRRQLDDRHR